MAYASHRFPEVEIVSKPLLQCAAVWSAMAFAALPAYAEGDRPLRLAEADEVVLPDGRFRTMADYLAGTWVWERTAPRQIRHMRFSRSGDFLYDNLTLALRYYGRYEVEPGALRLIIDRTCDTDRTRESCGERNPPLDRKISLRPIRADEFESQAERWNRLRRQ